MKIRLLGVKADFVSITGSVGKTTTKEATYAILQEKFDSFRTSESYNTDVGLTLSLLGQTTPFSNVSKWIKTLFLATFKAIFSHRGYQKIILEYGVDSKGDMDGLISMIQPNVGIFLNVKHVHMAEGQFKSLDEIYNEKKKMIFALPQDGWAIINMDDEYGMKLIKEIKEGGYQFNVVTFSISNPDAHIYASHNSNSEKGLEFTLHFGEETNHVRLKDVLGVHQIYALLPGIVCGFLCAMKWDEIYKGLQTIELPKGRMNLISGMRQTTIIDSSYNANPASMAAALEVLRGFNPKGRRIAVLGSMNELGESSEMHHTKVGGLTVGSADEVVFIGPNGNIYSQGAQEKGMAQSKIHLFDNYSDALHYLQEFLQKDDVILVKGSQNLVRLERLIKGIMADPTQASRLLVRQDEEWDRV